LCVSTSSSAGGSARTPLPSCLFLRPLRRPPSSSPSPYTTLFRSLPSNEPPSSPSCSTSSTRAPLRPAASAAAIPAGPPPTTTTRSEEHTSELQSRENLVCRLLLEQTNGGVPPGPGGHLRPGLHQR